MLTANRVDIQINGRAAATMFQISICGLTVEYAIRRRFRLWQSPLYVFEMYQVLFWKLLKLGLFKQ